MVRTFSARLVSCAQRMSCKHGHKLVKRRRIVVGSEQLVRGRRMKLFIETLIRNREDSRT